MDRQTTSVRFHNRTHERCKNGSRWLYLKESICESQKNIYIWRTLCCSNNIKNPWFHEPPDYKQTNKKFNSILKSHLPSHNLKRPFAPQLPTLLNTNSHIRNKAFGSQSLLLRPKASFATQLTLTNSKTNQHFKHPFASQMPLNVTKSQFGPNNCKVNNSHSINKFAAKELQMSDSKECEHSEQLSPIKPINGVKSNNPPNNAKFSAKAKIPKYKYHSLFAQNQPTNHSTVNKQNKFINSNNSVNHISKMSKAKAPRSKSTPTKARVTFSDTTPSLPGTNTTSNTETPNGSMIEETDDMLFTETLNKVFSKKFLAILTGKDAILKEVRDCVIRNDSDRLHKISPYLFSYWRDLSVKHGCVCLDERIAIPKSIKDAVLEDIHSTHPGSFAMLSLAQNIWWTYKHRDILAKASECKACTEIDKNLKSVISHRKWAPLPKCIEPNDEIQIDFGGSILIEKGIEQYFITSIDRYSKYPTIEIVNNASGPKVIKFLNKYIYITTEYLELLD